MKKSILFLLLNILFLSGFAQQKDFEGAVAFKVNMRSKIETISEQAWKNAFAIGNDLVVYIKNGNYKQVYSGHTAYYINRDQKAYIKFKGIDTLYYRDYPSDSTKINNISRPGEKKTIAGHECKLITVQSAAATRRYYYCPEFHINPEYDKNNTLGRYDVYVKETASLYLDYTEETNMYSWSQTCTHVQQTAINDSLFELPTLPVKKYSREELTISPEFTKAGGWEKYLQTKLNADIAAKYVKIPKGEKTGSVTAMVSFMVTESGRVVNAEVLNKKEIHSKLAEEALRVVNESPAWKPATFCGEKIFCFLQAPITFQAIRGN